MTNDKELILAKRIIRGYRTEDKAGRVTWSCSVSTREHWIARLAELEAEAAE